MENLERISPVVADYYKRMLGIKELPECLLEQYFRIKKLVDRIDGRLSIPDLAWIALESGFNPETMKFDGKVPAFILPTEESKTLTATGATLPEEPDLSSPEVVNQPITGDEVTMSEDKKTEKPLPPGTSVTVLYNEDLLQGKIVGSKGTDKKIVYTVELDDEEIINVSEDDIQVN